MTGSEEDSKLKVIEPRKVKQFSSHNNLGQDSDRQFTLKTNPGKSNHQSLVLENDTDILGSASNSSLSSRTSEHLRSRSSSVERGDIDSTRRVRTYKNHSDGRGGGFSSEIDKSVTSSSVAIDEDQRNLCLAEEDLQVISKEELVTIYRRLQDYVEELKRKHQDDLKQAKEIEAKVRLERNELSRREKVLIMRLGSRQRELGEAEKETALLKSSIVPSLGALRSTLLDPAVNLIIQKLKKDLDETKKKLEDTQNDLNAWKFTPDSNTGKRLMAKCRMLYLENEDLGKQTSSGRIAKLENDLALNKQLVTEMKQSQAEMDEVVQELDEDIEGLQSAIQHLQHELRSATERTTSDPSATSFKAESNSTSGGDPSLSVLCAQCRLTNATTTAGFSKLPESNTLRTHRTPPIIGGDNRTPPIELLSCFPRIEIDERTSLLNGQLTGKTTLNSFVKSVQSNSNSPKGEDSSSDEFESNPPNKRAKLNVGTESDKTVLCRNKRSVNGNGALDY